VLVYMFSDNSSTWLKGWVLAATILQLLAVARVHFLPGFNHSGYSLLNRSPHSYF
jgi:hypothetical protein